MRFAQLALGSLLFSICLLPSIAQGQVVFDNFGPGNTFNTRIGWTETGPSSGIGFASSQGEAFTPSATGQLSSIDIALTHVDGTNDAHLFLSNGIPGVAGTTTLETFTLVGLPAFGSTGVATFSSALQPLLSAGSTYFLYEVETGNEWNAWNENSIGETGAHISSENNSAYSSTSRTQGTFRVTIAPAAPPVPEPGSIALLTGMSLTGAAFLRRRKTDHKAA